MKKTFELDFRGRKLIVETGELAKQATGSVLVRYGDTVVLSTVVVSKTANVLSDFFPLMVLYQEKLYSVGKIPGGFIKREGRPTDAATLAARMIDRPMRPMFPEDFKNEVQIVNTVLSVDPDNSPELTAMFGSSLATSISKIPFDGPIAGVKVGRVNGEFVINPTVEELEVSDIELTVAGTYDAINMVEAGTKEVSEDDMLDALMFGHEAIKELCAFQKEIIAEVGQEKMEYEVLEISDDVRKRVTEYCSERLDKALRIKDKLTKYNAIDELKEEIVAKYEEENKDLDNEELNKLLTSVKLVFGEIEYELFRSIVVKEKLRADGREMTEIRPISTDIDLLPRTHGSALFTRGETQSLSVTTLGALGEHQILDGLDLETEKRFMLHYNFPQFSVGETGRYGAPGRREIGHGALGERALLQVIPSEEEFPYTIRVVSEILESNGSSSQASICALQMDIKIKGITKEILKKALAQAKVARMEILDKIEAQIPEPRKEVSKYAPKTMTFTIDPLKIKDVIGKGGEMITKIILDASGVTAVNDVNAVKVDLEDDGRVIIYHTDKEIIERTANMIKDIVRTPEEGKIYNAKVVKIIDSGCFVEIWPGCEGMVHISELDTTRVEKVTDVVKEGDEIIVKCLGYDKRGRLNLSRKGAIK